MYDFLLDDTIKTDKKIGTENCKFKIRFSTVICTGLEKSGKTSFCNLLMDKAVPSTSPSKRHTIFIKNKKTNEAKWIEINVNEVGELVEKLTRHKQSPNESGLLNVDEMWDILVLFDINVPSQALCLLQHSLVTFVTYKMLGKKFEKSSPEKLQYSRFVKEFLSSTCIKNKFHSDVSELEKKKKYYTAFVGVHNETSSEELYAEEAKVVNENLHTFCTNTEFLHSFWYIENSKNQDKSMEDYTEYLHLVNLVNRRDKHFDKIKNEMEEIVADNSIHEVPLSWMLLKFRIQKFCIENDVYLIEYITVLEEVWKTECSCFDEAELLKALKFFHNLGALFYYHSVEGINKFVFTDCHWIFDNLNYLYNFRNSAYQRDVNSKLALQYEGILKSDMIEKIKSDRLGKFIYFIKLLQHLKFIAPVNQDEFFIPSILDSYEDYKEEVFNYFGKPISKSLLITFSSGTVHRNVFCFLVAHILNQKQSNWSKLKYNKNRRHRHTFKDLAIFSVNLDSYVGYVYILDKMFFLEIQIYEKSKLDSYAAADLHHAVYTFIAKSLKAVCRCLQLKYDDCEHGFLCCSCKSELKQHLMVIKRITADSVTVCCNETGDLDVLKENSYTVWFRKVCLHMYVHTCNISKHTNECVIVSIYLATI